MAFRDLTMNLPSKLIVTDPDPDHHPDSGEWASLAEWQVSEAGPQNTAAFDSRKIKRRPLSTQTAIYSPINPSGETNEANSTTRTQYATTEKAEQVPAPRCSASCSCHQQESTCKSPSSSVAAIEDELSRERLARQEAESKQRVAEAEIRSLKSEFEAAMELCNQSKDEMADLELRIADGDRELERLHGKLDEEYDRRMKACCKIDDSVTADEADRPASKHSTRSDAQQPLLHRIRSKMSLLNIKDTVSQTQHNHELESQNSSLRTEVKALEQAVDKWFSAFETEKDNYSSMKDRYLRESSWVRLWKASADQALESLERKQKAHNEDIADYNRLVEVLKSRDQEIVALKADRDEMIVKILGEREEVERVAGKKEKWKGWAWRQKRLADGLWGIAVEGCRRCGVGWERKELVAELEKRGSSSQVDAEGPIGSGRKEEAAAARKEDLTGKREENDGAASR
ncbi:hypothetical protein EJ03DRAFT_350253 [Teratosphaeria nubilosa]|uniref:Uncharacterized protein n=1 Tax=Teratosphaeria nubilosa TaxID=161662 RepID=A0A6G1LDL3_9PEZI|nr:hypothetical protein EJ03DRAFT_350253 [Teratosphaeria nubilosa]